MPIAEHRLSGGPPGGGIKKYVVLLTHSTDIDVLSGLGRNEWRFVSRVVVLVFNHMLDCELLLIVIDLVAAAYAREQHFLSPNREQTHFRSPYLSRPPYNTLTASWPQQTEAESAVPNPVEFQASSCQHFSRIPQDQHDTRHMPADLEDYCKRILDDIVTTSQSIRRSALAHANDQNLQTAQRLRSQLETIRISADAILEAITEATIADELKDWLFSGELRSCLGRLREMDMMLRPVDSIRSVRAPGQPFGLGEDKLTAAMAFFDRHKGLFIS